MDQELVVQSVVLYHLADFALFVISIHADAAQLAIIFHVDALLLV